MVCPRIGPRVWTISCAKLDDRELVAGSGEAYMPGCLPCAPMSIAAVRKGGLHAPSTPQRSSTEPLRQRRSRQFEVQGHVVRNYRLAVVTQRVWFRAPDLEPSPFVKSLGLGRGGDCARATTPARPGAHGCRLARPHGRCGWGRVDSCGRRWLRPWGGVVWPIRRLILTTINK